MRLKISIRHRKRAFPTARGFLRTQLSLLLVMAASAVTAQNLPPVMKDVRGPEQLQGDLERADSEIVMLHFWASWCIPCREEMTSLAQFWRQEYPALADRGLRVLTVSNDVRDKDLERFAEEFELAFPLYYDPYSKLTSRYGVRGLPSTVVLDSNGEVIDQILGDQDWLAADFNQRIEALLREVRGGRKLDLTVRHNPRR
jgi:thiol-disulfide isomerase/thioredoxin